MKQDRRVVVGGILPGVGCTLSSNVDGKERAPTYVCDSAQKQADSRDQERHWLFSPQRGSSYSKAKLRMSQ